MRSLALALLILAGGAPGVAAQTMYAPAGEQITTTHAVRHARNAAERYWHARGVQPCPMPTIYVAPSLGVNLELERAEQPGCTVWLLDWIAAGGDETALGARILCRVMIHALGHTAGLGHARRGVMQPVMDLSAPIRGPRACVRRS
jgi:hypothetical protein